MNTMKELWAALDKARENGHTYRSIADEVNKHHIKGGKKLSGEYLAVLRQRAADRSYSAFVSPVAEWCGEHGFLQGIPRGYSRGEAPLDMAAEVVTVDLIPLTSALAVASERSMRSVVGTLYNLIERTARIMKEAQAINAAWASIRERLATPKD